jgi:ribonuclease Z
MKEIIMLGTGHAAVTKCYNTCFVIKNGEKSFLVDAGGGNTILSRMNDAGIKWGDIAGMFITHAHTDHLCGAVWVVRFMMGVLRSGKYEGDFCIYCHDEVKKTLEFMCDNMLANGKFDWCGGKIKLVEVQNGDNFQCNGGKFTVFDIFSTKKKQFGFRLELDGTVITCLGDEPYNEKCEKFVLGSDWLMSDAFCLDEDAEKFKPGTKHHATALEAATTAQKLGAKNLILYHTEDGDLAHRKERYTAEAKRAFGGTVYVPDDLERIAL